MMKENLIQVICGPGKGKTASALGRGVTALLKGKTVIMVQFLKGSMETEGMEIVKRLEPEFKLFRFEKSPIFFDQLSEEEKDEARINIRNGLNFAKKVLVTGECDILILDEPTAVLTPQETEKLFTVLRNMREAGHSIIIITHKLHEVLSLSDRVSVLRKGAYIGTVQTKDATEASLTEMMVGKKVALNIERPEPVNPQKRLVMEHVTCVDKEGVKTLDDAGFTAYSGEILGIAGIAGSGQKELLETIAGLQPMEGGTIRYYPPEGGEETLSGMSPAAIRKLGIKLSFVPEDRLGMGLVAAMGMTDNMMLRGYKKGIPFFTDRRTPKAMAEQLIKELEIVTPGVSTPVGRLSGGNVQKVLVGREISSNPRVLMVAYPVRGLDINSSYTIYHLLNEQKKQGAAVICVGEDLDVLLELCDRILVLCGGKVSGIVDGRTATKEEIGLMMTKTGGGQDE